MSNEPEPGVNMPQPPLDPSHPALTELQRKMQASASSTVPFAWEGNSMTSGYTVPFKPASRRRRFWHWLNQAYYTALEMVTAFCVGYIVAFVMWWVLR